MQLSTAVWHILNGKPIPPEMAGRVIDILRDHPSYLKTFIRAASTDYKEELAPKMAKYAEEYRKSPNQSGSIKPKFIVLHHTQGNYSGSVSWILKKISKVSYHYIINPKNGSRIQFVFDAKKAWHAGKSQWKKYTNLNSHSIGIAFDRDTNKRTPEFCEIDSCAKKIIYLLDKFNLDIGAIVTHAMISPGRKTDCSEETYDLVLKRVRHYLNMK